MKKVNWTSRAEIFGSTKVVIVFMFLVAAVLLFAFDLLFGTLFWALRHPPRRAVRRLNARPALPLRSRP